MKRVIRSRVAAASESDDPTADAPPPRVVATGVATADESATDPGDASTVPDLPVGRADRVDRVCVWPGLLGHDIGEVLVGASSHEHAAEGV